MFTLSTLSRSSEAVQWRRRVLPVLALSSAMLVSHPLSAGSIQLPEGGYPDGMIGKRVEEQVEERVEQAVIDDLTERVLTLGGYPAGYIESKVEDSIADRVLTLGGYPAGYIEQQVENKVEENLAQNIDDDLGDQIEESLEETVEESVAENLEENLEESVAETIEEEIVDNIEAIVEENVAENLEENLEQGLEQEIEAELELTVAENIDGAIDSEIDRLLQTIENEIEVDENRIHKNQWLVMAEIEVFDELAKEGYLFDEITDLPSIGMRLAQVAAPSSFDITEARQGVIDVVGSERVKVDFNHIYTAGVKVASTEQGILPLAAIDVPADIQQLKLRIGMIDSAVDTSHPSLQSSQIKSRSFVSRGAEVPDFHGTAIASIIAGNGPGYRGLAPNTELYAAAVFERDEARGEFASTVSLIMALDWLVSTGVDVVNISLAGPPNSLLEAALTHAVKRNVLILAAAGNGGPLAKPMYPAAYDSVVAVTAVDVDGQVFRLANRGSYLDLAAPGVNLQHAKAGGGYASSSGTSFAVPFAAAAAARIRLLQPTENAREILNNSARDIGPPGRDEIYGYGLLRLGAL